MLNIKERILYFIEFKGLRKEKFIKSIGMSYGSFKGRAKTTPINSKAIEKILKSFPDLNPEWLILGKEPMLKSQDVSPFQVKEKDVTYSSTEVSTIKENLAKAMQKLDEYKKMINILRSEVKFLRSELQKYKPEDQ